MKKIYHLITIGCQMNKADSERLSAFLEAQGYKSKSNFQRGVDLVIINTCSIRQSAEDRLYGLVNQIRKDNPGTKIVVTGCLSKRPDVLKRLEDRVDLFMPINETPNILDLLEKREIKTKLSLDEVRLLQGEKYLGIVPKHQSKISALVPIGNGCNNFCSYCVVPYARGREVYRPAKEIISEVKILIAKGYKEIILIAQNVNSYNDKTVRFPELLKKLASIKGEFWIRFSSSHPKDVSLELIKAIVENKKVCPHLHLALQSGDDKILQAMNRKYTVAHFLDVVSKVRRARPGIAITTDVIIGFPGENKSQFNNSVKLFKATNFDLAYVSRYSPRPGTAAYNLKDDVSVEEKKRREAEIEKMIKQTALNNSQAYVGRIEKVLIEGINKRGLYYGKTGSYKVVVIDGPSSHKKIGVFAAVAIYKAEAFKLYGKLAG